jgi:hypothetical protein
MPADADTPICGRDSRLHWLRTELIRQIESPRSTCVTRKEILGWFLRYGHSLGFSRDELLSCLKHDEQLLGIAEDLREVDILAGKPPPAFSPGQSVEVVLNGRNTTYRQGLIGEMRWHFKDGMWHYWIVENGRRVSKRYEARDLKPTDPHPDV